MPAAGRPPARSVLPFDRPAPAQGHRTVVDYEVVHARAPSPGLSPPSRGRRPRAALADAYILIVDPEPRQLSLLTRLLHGQGFTRLDTTVDPHEALSWMRQRCPDLLILNLQLPGLDAFDLIERLAAGAEQGIPWPPPVLAVGGTRDPGVRLRALQAGARDFVSAPFNALELGLRVGNIVETRSLHRAIADRNRSLEHLVGVRTRELDEARHELIDRLAQAAEFRDDDTGDHAFRVGRLARDLALALGQSHELAEALGRAAALHDIGKVGIPDSILLKAGALDEDEAAIVQMHTVVGAEILSGSQDPLLRLAERIAISHHERWDGTGYPAGLAGSAIPLEGRITAVADAFDVMTHARRYGPVYTESEALEEISAQRGRQFDPDVVDALQRVLTRGLAAA